MLEKLKGAIKNGQSRDTATLGIRQWTKTKKKPEKKTKQTKKTASQKSKKMNNTDTLLSPQRKKKIVSSEYYTISNNVQTMYRDFFIVPIACIRIIKLCFLFTFNWSNSWTVWEYELFLTSWSVSTIGLNHGINVKDSISFVHVLSSKTAWINRRWTELPSVWRLPNVCRINYVI